MSSETNSDTLQERWEALRDGLTTNTPTAIEECMEDAIEYAAQLEAMLAYACGEPDRERFVAESLAGENEPEDFSGRLNETIGQRNKARADRDRLHEHLSEQAVGVSMTDGSRRCLRCGATRMGPMTLEDHNEDCVLREVERGDTVDKIRREALFDHIDHLEQTQPEHEHDRWERAYGAGRIDAIEQLRALAEGDDQEEDDE